MSKKGSVKVIQQSAEFDKMVLLLSLTNKHPVRDETLRWDWRGVKSCLLGLEGWTDLFFDEG